jgi:transcriptional regulator with XRE-family HTH domain
MNQLKTGKFIAECRKNKNLTQMQLAEKLGITDKAISKWERGIAMPDASIMLELCNILGITVNELLNGEKILIENVNNKNEKLLVNMAKEIERKNKMIWTSMIVIIILSITALLLGAIFSYYFLEGIWQIVATIGVCLVFLPSIFYALKLEISVGVYKCRHCGHEIIPTYKNALNAMHIGTTRYLKCPNCKKRSWCKKIVK